MKLTLIRLGLAALVASALAGCGGGSDGVNGPAGTPATTVTVPVAVPGISVAALTPDQWAALQPQGTITGVTINSPPEVTFILQDPNGNAITGLEKNTTKSATALVASYANVSATIAKLVPGSNGAPSRWVSYNVTTVATTTTASVPGKPTSDSTGTLSYLGDGKYKYTFYRDIKLVKAAVDGAAFTGNNKKEDLDDLTFDPNLTHRVVVSISGNARGTGTNTSNGADSGIPGVPLKNPANIVYDFVPATGNAIAADNANPALQRNLVNISSCKECHTKFSFHGGGRQDTKLCVTCHTDQRKYGNAEATTTATGFSGTVGKLNGMATMNMPVMIHKIHMGEELTKTGTLLPGFSEAVNEIRYPQVITNCVKCHDGTPGGTPASTTNKFTFTAAQGNNWKAVPNRLACGACHDNVNFTTGVNHVTAGARADDSSCATCHTPAAVDASHLAVTPLNTGSALHVNGGDANTNAAAIASVAKDLPTGAIRVTYDIRKVYRNTSKQPVMEFRMLQDGVRKDLNVFDAAGSVATQELWPNFMGAPSVYFVFAVPQDGIAAPADFNAAANVYLRNLWNGTALTVNAGSGGAGKGTLTGPDGSGYYTATLTGVTIPDNAVMLTGGLGYSYNNTSTLPLTQTNLAKYPVSAATATITANTSTTQYSTMPNKIGGLIVLTPDLQVVASAGAAAGGTGGAYTGRRAIVEDARCNNCHQELGVFNKSSFHAGQRNDGTTCSWCHTPNRASSGWSADSTSFVHAIHAKEMLKTPFSWHRNATTDFSKVTFPGVLNNCEACHKPGTYDFALAANEAAVPNRQVRLVANGKFNRATDTFGAISPRVTADNVFDYGVNFSFNAATGVTTAAAGTTLVNSPITAACFACHDSDQAKLHMESNSGSIYRTRTEALAKPETCLVCHGSGRTADIKVMHSK